LIGRIIILIKSTTEKKLSDIMRIFLLLLLEIQQMAIKISLRKLKTKRYFSSKMEVNMRVKPRMGGSMASASITQIKAKQEMDCGMTDV
jgi:hypothetical protein